MPCRNTRREFLKTTATIGLGYWVAGAVRAAESTSPNEQIAMASIGVAGKGTSDSNDAAAHGRMVAICDVDEKRLRDAGEKRFPKAKRYVDFRKMLDEMGRKIDAVTVSTADHTHAPAALMAMRMGKHCFCQKPLTRTVYEARLMAQVAREKKLATQMGNQGTAESSLRKAAAWLRAGVLGAVKEVHIWTNRPIWPQGQARPGGEDAVPGHLDWDLWLAAAPARPYKDTYLEGPFKGKNVYHPFVWRGWWDFGSGALGDMGCHEINMAFRGLELRNPVSVQAVTSGHNRDSYPAWSIVTYEFAATAARPALKMIWYDGGKRPPAELLRGIEGQKRPEKPRAAKKEGAKKEGAKRREGKKARTTGAKPSDGPAEGKVIVGEKGRLWGYGTLLDGAQPVEVEFPKSPGHFEEWVRAIKGGEPAMSNFPDYAGPLAEIVLLGNLALWAADKINTTLAGEKAAQGEKIEWDAEKLQAKNVPGLEPLIKPAYRQGYTLDV